MVLRSLAARPSRRTQVRVVDQTLERVNQGRGIAGGDDKSVDPVGDHLGYPADRVATMAAPVLVASMRLTGNPS